MRRLPSCTSVMVSSPSSRESRIKPCSQFDEKASSTFSTRCKSDRRGVLRAEVDVDAVKYMRAKRKSIEVIGVEICPEESKDCKEVDTSSDNSSSLMMQALVGPEEGLLTVASV